MVEISLVSIKYRASGFACKKQEGSYQNKVYSSSLLLTGQVNKYTRKSFAKKNMATITKLELVGHKSLN